MKKLIYLTIVFAMLSCQQAKEVMQKENIQYSPVFINDYHHTDIEELIYLYEIYSENYSLLHYREARILAYADLLGGCKDFLNKEYDFKKIYLSQYPVVIFNYNNIPEYYEFTLYHDTEAIATITTEARKVSDGVISYILPPFNYINDNKYIHYIGKYPYEKYYSNNYESQMFFLDSNNKLVELEKRPIMQTDSEILDTLIKLMPEEDQNSYQQYAGEIKRSMEDEILKTINYWSETNILLIDFIKPYGNKIDFLNKEVNANKPNEYSIWLEEDKEIAKKINDNFGYCDSKIYEIPAYKNNRLRCTFWDGWCGPSALAFIYRGIYSHYPLDSENYLPICGDGLLGNQGITYNLPKFSDGPNFAYYNFDITLPNGTKNPIDSFIKISNIADYGLSSCFYQQTIPTKGCKNYYFPLYDNGIKRGIEKATNKNYSSRFTVVPEKEINNNNPLMIVVHCDHYIVAIAKGLRGDKKFYFVVDNGKKTKDYGYLPYWHNYKFRYLHYAIHKK